MGPRTCHTKLAVSNEISDLWKLALLIPQFDDTGDDNREAIEAQLSVLTDLLTDLQVIEEFGTDLTEANVMDAAMCASQWLDGVGEVPSARWHRAVLQSSDRPCMATGWPTIPRQG
jgi:hypothetical protein